MSVRCIQAVFEHSRATLAARLVLIVLADAAAEDGISWPHQERLAALACVAEKTVRRSIEILEESGELEVRKVMRGTTRQNVYRVRLPGVLPPDYTRLPFDLERPFSEGDRSYCPVAPEAQNAVDVRSLPPKLSGPAGAAYPVEPKGEPLRTPQTPLPAVRVAQQSRPGKADGVKVTDDEFEQATAVLALFNLAAGTRYVGKEWITKIVLRLREKPTLTLDDHRLIITRSFENPWWRGPASPSVIYGNGALFETQVHRAVADQAQTAVLSAADYETTIAAGHHDAVGEATEVE